MKRILKILGLKKSIIHHSYNSAYMKELERACLKNHSHINRILLKKVPLDHPRIKSSYNFLLRCED
jgi:hypothetical protein